MAGASLFICRLHINLYASAWLFICRCLIIYMKAHDFLFADTADDCATGIETRHRRASEETRGASEET